MKNAKGQILITVFLLLLIVSVLGGALTIMWMSEIKTSQAQNDATRAFYMANAGIERGKLILLGDVTTAAGWYPTLPSPNDWYLLTGYGRYKFKISAAGAGKKNISAIGEALNSSNNSLAQRRLTVKVDGITDGADAGSEDDDFTMTIMTDSWKELTSSDAIP